MVKLVIVLCRVSVSFLFFFFLFVFFFLTSHRCVPPHYAPCELGSLIGCGLSTGGLTKPSRLEEAASKEGIRVGGSAPAQPPARTHTGAFVCFRCLGKARRNNTAQYM